MSHIFIFHRDLRIIDNTSLIKQMIKYNHIIPVFIFTPTQIKKNDYFSNNSVQFMIESLHELYNDTDNKLMFFYGNQLDVIKNLNKIDNIKSISFNIDYTPYARERDEETINYCKNNNIDIITYEDYTLYNILDGDTLNKNNNKPYTVFTHFKNHCMKNLKVNKPDLFNDFKFKYNNKYIKSKYYLDYHDINKFYKNNENINVHGGRKNALNILSNIHKFKDYNTHRDFLNYNTTHLSAYLHFTTVSIREVYYNIIKKLSIDNNLINELHWRDFYTNITFYFPHVLKGSSFKLYYDKIKWSNDIDKFNLWCNGLTGFPIVDAAMNQLNITGYMHNRCRMIVASFLCKDLLIDWRWGEKYFATKLVDYSPMQNNGGWQFCSSTGNDAQPYFRIFNPWTQSKKFDKDCIYIKKWLPILSNIENKHIHEWFKYHDKYNIDYPEPIINHDIARKNTLKIYSKITK
jgi:deoxyribodipyrimidine photo-lyase